MARPFSNYLARGPVLVRAESAPALRDIDTIVFDVDGVLVDVTRSFRRCISLTTQRYLETVFGARFRARYLRVSEVALFKRAGGFNNDWELTEAAILFYLMKHALSKATEPAALRAQPPTLKAFLERVSERGGGVAKAREVLRELSPSNAVTRQAFDLFDPRAVRSLFVSLYAGRLLARIYPDLHIPVPRQRGLIESEPILIDESLIDPRRFRYGILTGRTSGELSFTLERFSRLPDAVGSRVRVDDGGALKPEAEALLPLVSDARTALYIGDTFDDLLTVVNARASRPDIEILFGAIAHTREDRTFFAARGADMIASSVNDILSLVNHSRQGASR